MEFLTQVPVTELIAVCAAIIIGGAIGTVINAYLHYPRARARTMDAWQKQQRRAVFIARNK